MPFESARILSLLRANLTRSLPVDRRGAWMPASVGAAKAVALAHYAAEEDGDEMSRLLN
jgi:hypothetical protein